MATTASVQDIDSFIRLQKEKLNREKNFNSNSNYQQPLLQDVEFDYNKRLDNYLTLPRTFENFETSYNIENQNPVIKQPPLSSIMPNPPAARAPQQRNFSPERSNNTNRNQKENDNPANDENFYNKFGVYENKKNQLKNDLHQEYNEYLQKKNSNNRNAKANGKSKKEEFFATLPLKGMDSAKEKAKKQRNYEYQVLQNKLETSEKGRKLDWWKDRNSPVVKPYSVDRQEIAKEPSQDVISNRRLQFNNQLDGPPGQSYKQMSPVNSYENLNYQQPIEAWRTPVPPPIQQMPQMAPVMQPMVAPLVDASLADILRRPPVGYKPQMQFPPSYGMPTNMYEMNDPYRYQQSQSPTYPSQPVMNNQYANYQAAPQALPPQMQQNYNKGNTTQRKTDSFGFSEDPAKEAKAQKAKEYQEELERQVREKKLQKQREKEEQARLDQKLLLENNNYNPYGKSGGGAPIRDRSGNVVANLREVLADPEKYSPREMPPPNASNFSPSYNQPNVQQFNFGNFPTNSKENLIQQFGFNTQAQPNSNLNKPPDESQKPTFARGGNGIFGEARTEEQKRQKERYQAELQKQIEDKKRAKEEEKERQRIEDEKEMKRIKEQHERMQAELEEEERKKKIKEDQRRAAEDSKRQMEQQLKKQTEQNKKSNQVKQGNKKFTRANNNNPETTSVQESQVELNEPSPPQFRSDSPPVPTIAKKGDKTKPGGTNAPKGKSKETPNYYVTESKLNVNETSQNNNDTQSNLQSIMNVRSNSGTEFFSENKSSDPLGEFPTKPVLRKQVNRSPSVVSDNEMLSQLKSLKKHLNNEKLQIENQLNNANNKTTIGQMSDIRQSILNVKTPPGDRDIMKLALKEPFSSRRENSDFQRTYRKYLDKNVGSNFKDSSKSKFEAENDLFDDITDITKEIQITPPIQGGLEPRTYYRDNTVLLDNQKNDIFQNDLQKQAHERQLNRMNQLNLPLDYAEEQLTARNQQRLKKLRNIEDDSLSNADPNDVLEKFLSRNNRQPSAATLNDDTWLRNPA